MITGIVLAAGTSTRLGTPKQLLELDGRPLLQHVVDAACASSLDEVLIVLGHEAEIIQVVVALPDTARAVLNEDYETGQSSSLRAGLAAASHRSEAAAILLGDQPGMTPALIDEVIERWRATNAPIVRPTFQGTPGHPVIVGRGEWGSFARVEGDRGAGAEMERDPARVEIVEMGMPPLEDVDTWEQYERTRDGRETSDGRF